MCIRAHLYLRTITNCLITRGYRTVQYHYWAPNSFTLLCRFLHNMLTNTGHCINGQCMGMVHGLLPCMPPRPRGAGGDDGTWCYGECRGKCECLIFFRVSPRMPGPPGGRRGGWHMVLRRAQRQVLVHPSPPLPPPGPDPSRLTPLPPPVSRLPPVVPSRSPAPGAPAPALSFFCLAKLPPAWGRDEAYGECRGT